MDDAVTRYCAASETADVDAMLATLAPDGALASPLSGSATFRGRDDLRVLFAAVYGTIDGLRWSTPVGDGTTRVVLGTGRVGGVRVDDAMVFELDDDGLIRTVRPHLRPWLATTVFALLLAPKIARHPGVLWRAMRSPVR
jgi:SnoaL-like domain